MYYLFSVIIILFVLILSINQVNGVATEFSEKNVVESLIEKKIIAQSNVKESKSTETNSENHVILKIPDWVRKNAKWWSLTKISDKDFSSGIEYLVQHKVIQIPDTIEPEHGAYEKNLPGWLRKDAGWWSQRLVTDEEFAKSLKWMIINRFVKI